MVIKGHRFNEESEQSLTNTTDLPYKNPNLPAEERIADLLGRMTLEEKVGQMLSLIHISEHTRLQLISYAVF